MEGRAFAGAKVTNWVMCTLYYWLVTACTYIYGHAEGDYAIRYVAECIKRACVETNSFISRYGGDEFIILYEDTEEQGVEELCNKIHTELDRGEQPYRLGVSFGVAKCTNNDVKWQDLFVKADERLYIEKKNKKIR